MKDDDEPSEISFSLIPLNVGVDEQRSTISSAALEYREKSSTESFRLTNSGLYAVETFNEASKRRVSGYFGSEFH